ncbi:MAG: DUF222 domain-containing protein [Acidimicrobiia bacterium]
MEHLSTCIISGSLGDSEAVLGRMDDQELEDLALDIVSHLDAGYGWLVHAVAEIDRRQIPQRRHVLTTRQWLKQFGRMTKTAAGRVVRTATAMSELPNAMKRSIAGEIPADSLRLIAAARDRHRDAFPLHEETFAEIASYLDPWELKSAIAHWEQQVDHAGALDDIESRTARRRMSLHQTLDGMWHHDGLYDPESGHTISAALRAHADPGNLDASDSRTYGQRMVDGLTDVCRFWLDHNESAATSGGEKPHVTVVVDADALVSPTDPLGGLDECGSDRATSLLPEIDGAPIHPEAVHRIGCDSSVVRIVMDSHGQPLDIGRRVRTVTPAIRRAIDIRDGGCRWHGCDAPIGWCDAHHIVHWAAGGTTSMDNLVLLCRRHHTAVHEGKRPVAGLPGVPRPDG